MKHGGVWTSHPQARLVARVADSRLCSRHVFGTQTASFHVCARCGVTPFVTSQIEGRTYAVVSVNALDGIDRSRLRTTPASFDGEGVGERLVRRARNWIADVTVEEGA